MSSALLENLLCILILAVILGWTSKVMILSYGTFIWDSFTWVSIMALYYNLYYWWVGEIVVQQARWAQTPEKDFFLLSFLKREKEPELNLFNKLMRNCLKWTWKRFTKRLGFFPSCSILKQNQMNKIYCWIGRTNTTNSRRNT